MYTTAVSLGWTAIDVTRPDIAAALRLVLGRCGRTGAAPSSVHCDGPISACLMKGPGPMPGVYFTAPGRHASRSARTAASRVERTSGGTVP